MVAINLSRKHGIASLESFRDRLRICIPRSCFGGKQKYLTLGLSDTPKNRALAQSTLDAMQSDINLGTFDITLERYKPKVKQQSYLKAVSELHPQMKLSELWESYLKYLTPIRKASTMHYLKVGLTPNILACPIQSPYKAVEIRDWLLSRTTPSMTKRILTQLNAAFNWGLKHKNLTGTISPFEGMAKEFKHRYEQESNANAFTLEERDRIIEAYKKHKINGCSYSYYASFVEFLFLTGCRPNEAVGLEWKDIDSSSRFISFNGGIYCANGKAVSSKGQGSKNNKFRTFPCNEKLRNLLESLPKTNALVFPSPKGKAINYNNFSKKPWHTIVDPIKLNTTPYSCRDTFITEQIAKGVNIGTLSKWTDNSVQTIEKYYLDINSMNHILPL
jgi:integrase